MARQPFDDEARLARATGPLDRAALALSSARAGAAEARRAVEASYGTLPADDRTRVQCSRRAALSGACVEDTAKAIVAARAR